jgi:hypothetical protein
MKPKLGNLFFSIALIVVGGLLLAQNLGYIHANSYQLWTWVFGGASILFFGAYVSSGLRRWGFLFPALILGALGLVTGLSNAGFESPALGSAILAGVALPFFAAFATDTRKNYWALIPGSILGVVAFIPLIENRVAGEIIGAMVLFSLAVPFLLIYLISPERRWALIPALVLGSIALIPLMVSLASQTLLPVLVLLVIALPFAIVFVVSRSSWWALIPAGFFASIALSILAAGGARPESSGPAISGGMFLGWALTFFILWLLRASKPTAWAIYPSLVLAVVAVVSFAFSPSLSFIWPVALILAGGFILYNALRKPRLLE